MRYFKIIETLARGYLAAFISIFIKFLRLHILEYAKHNKTNSLSPGKFVNMFFMTFAPPPPLPKIPSRKSPH